MSKITKPEKVGFSKEKLEHIGESMRSLIEAKKFQALLLWWLGEERLFILKRME